MGRGPIRFGWLSSYAPAAFSAKLNVMHTFPEESSGWAITGAGRKRKFRTHAGNGFHSSRLETRQKPELRCCPEEQQRLFFSCLRTWG